MLNRRSFLTTLLVPIAAPSGVARLLAQAAPPAKPGAPQIPPLSYTCPMHAEVVLDQPGKCPVTGCGMTLVPVRLALVWSCSIHTEVTKHAAGTCPKCGRPLVRVTKAVTFTCPVHSKIDSINPGNCPICKRTLVMKYSVRPHGDHNPKHGGYFLMASNNWHLEMTHPAAGVFHLYIYDEYSKPFSPPGLAARIIEEADATGKKTTVAIPFKKIPAKGYWEARIPGLALPATIAAKVRFEANDKEYRFDFMFPDYSKEPPARVGR